MLRLEKVNGNNVWDILKLSVNDSQKEFVASNEISIIEAYTAITAHGYAYPFGIYDSDELVGFMMIGFDKDDYWEDAPEIATGNYNLWRLMIDKKYPCGQAEYCWLSYEPENQVAKDLYASYGFVETGDMDGEEIIAVLKL